MPRIDESTDHFLRGLELGKQRANDLWPRRLILAVVCSLIFGMALGILLYIEILDTLILSR